MLLLLAGCCCCGWGWAAEALWCNSNAAGHQVAVLLAVVSLDWSCAVWVASLTRCTWVPNQWAWSTWLGRRRILPANKEGRPRSTWMVTIVASYEGVQ